MNSCEIYWYGMVCEFGFDSGAKNISRQDWKLFAP
jgi:hypothetical protein